jgi:streptothricin acetyltransferase
LHAAVIDNFFILKDLRIDMEIRKIDAGQLRSYSEVSIAFEVRSVYRIELPDNGLGGMTLHERTVSPTYVKDYDAYEDGSPEQWPRRFNIDNWGLFIGFGEKEAVAGAAIAFNTPELQLMDKREDLAILWDIRVRPDQRRSGIGKNIFRHSCNWARKQGAVQLKIETQNVNVPACRFYKKLGCSLGQIDRYAYAGHPEVGHEIMLVWYYDLQAGF